MFNKGLKSRVRDLEEICVQQMRQIEKICKHDGGLDFVYYGDYFKCVGVSVCMVCGGTVCRYEKTQDFKLARAEHEAEQANKRLDELRKEREG